MIVSRLCWVCNIGPIMGAMMAMLCMARPALKDIAARDYTRIRGAHNVFASMQSWKRARRFLWKPL